MTRQRLGLRQEVGGEEFTLEVGDVMVPERNDKSAYVGKGVAAARPPRRRYASNGRGMPEKRMRHRHAQLRRLRRLGVHDTGYHRSATRRVYTLERGRRCQAAAPEARQRREWHVRRRGRRRSRCLLPRTRSEGEGTIGVLDRMLSATGEEFALKQRAPLSGCCARSKLATGEACQKERAPQSRCCACSESVTGRRVYVRKEG